MKEMEKELEWIRDYVGQCIDDERIFDIHELWEWLDRLVGEFDEEV